MRTLPLVFVATLAAADQPKFQLQVAPNEGSGELLRRASLHCGGAAFAVGAPQSGTFVCGRAVDVAAQLATAELVVRGVVTRIETVDLKRPSGVDPEVRRATLEVTRTLKGPTRKTLSFLFVNSTADAYAGYPKPKLQQDGVWLLSRDGQTREFSVFDASAAQPANKEDALRELLKKCPTTASGRCETVGWQCPYEATLCSCEAACPGGINKPRDTFGRWICRPNACSTAVNGASCTPEGTQCEGCWGTFPVRCEQGRWKIHNIAPPP